MLEFPIITEIREKWRSYHISQGRIPRCLLVPRNKEADFVKALCNTPVGNVVFDLKRGPGATKYLDMWVGIYNGDEILVYG